MGWMKIRMPDRTWRSISKAAGPPDAQGVLKVRHWDGTWVQHARSSTPDTEPLYLRRGSSWEQALRLEPAEAPRTRWDLRMLGPSSNFQIMHWFGTTQDNTPISYIHKEKGWPGGFQGESSKEVNWGGGWDTPAPSSRYAVGHTTVDLGLIRRNLPGEPASAVIEFQLTMFASADGSASNPGLDNPRLNFPYSRYNAHIYETTGQPTLTSQPVTNPYSFRFLDRSTLTPLTDAGDVLVVDDAGFIVSGDHIGSVNFWDDTEWLDDEGWRGRIRVDKPGTKITRHVTGLELALLDHLDFAIYCDEIEAPPPTTTPNQGSDPSWTNYNEVRALAHIIVTTYENA